MIAPDRWVRIEPILERALELPQADRAEFLEQASGGDASLYGEVWRLLEASDAAGESLLEGSAAELAGPLLEEPPAGVAVEEPPELPERFGPWRVVRLLGRGGMGVVYLAERDDERYDRRVAIKLVPSGPLGAEFRTRFALEQRILASLEHPYIARMYDAGVGEDGTPFFVMEYVRGRRIDDHCDEERLPIRARLALFQQVCDAVQFAHAKLVVHRDLKPSNIFVSNDGTVKLLDFGIAKLLPTDEDGRTVTALGGFHALTPEYASPEQLRGESISTATDVYALGVLLYELLSGRSPYRVEDRSPLSLQQAVLEQEPERPSVAVTRPPQARNGHLRPAERPARHQRGTKRRQVEATRAAGNGSAASARRSTTLSGLRRQLRGDLDNIVLTALRKEPDRRYASVEQLREDIGNYLERRPVRARSATWSYRAAKFVRRHRTGVAATAFVSVALIAGLLATAWQARVASREAQRADRVRDFVVELFEVSDPDEARGEEITARALLDRGAERLETELSEEPVVRAEMLGILGTIYRRLGIYDRARPLLEEALSSRLALLGPRHLDVAHSASQLVTLLHDQGKFERAEELARQALDIRRRRLGPEDTLVAASMSNLASVLSARGGLEEAEELHRAALEIDRRHGSPRLIASDLNSVSLALWRRGKYAEAVPFAEEAVALRREIHGDEHTEVATAVMNLGTLLRDVAEYERAEELYREALAMRRKLLGPEHPYVAITLNELAALHFARGRPAEGEALLHEALAIRRASLGEGHPRVAGALAQLGFARYAQRDHAGAADYFERALEIWRPALGDRHPHVITGLSNLGAVRREQGDLDAAERALREALELRLEVLGPEHSDVGSSYNNLALVLQRRGEYAAAEEHFRAALATWRVAFGPDHPTPAFALVDLGELLIDVGRLDEAEPLLREGLQILLARFEEDNLRVAEARLHLGRALLGLERFQEAEPLLLAAYPPYATQRGDDHPITRLARSALAELYVATGRPEEALAYSR